MEKRVLIASWLFLIGSALFMIDAVSEVMGHFSLMSLLHLSEGMLFLVGSLFFMPEQQSERQDQVQPSEKLLDLEKVLARK